MALDPSIFVVFTCAQSGAVVIHSFTYSVNDRLIVADKQRALYATVISRAPQPPAPVLHCQQCPSVATAHSTQTRLPIHRLSCTRHEIKAYPNFSYLPVSTVSRLISKYTSLAFRSRQTVCSSVTSDKYSRNETKNYQLSEGLLKEISELHAQ